MSRKNVLIVGGGDTGTYLATLLLKSDCEVHIVEYNPQIYDHLIEDFPPDVAIYADGTNPFDMIQAGITDVDVLLAVTGNDETNLVVSSLAKFDYHVQRVIMRINNPHNAWIATPEMGVDVALNQCDLIASIILEELSLNKLQLLGKLNHRSLEIVEEKISSTSSVINKPIAALDIPPNCNIFAVLRGDDAIVGPELTVLQPNDEVLAVVLKSERAALQNALA